jgi:hypothetical protein
MNESKMAQVGEMNASKIEGGSPAHTFHKVSKKKATDSLLFDYAAKGNIEKLRELFSDPEYLTTVNINIGDEKV